MSRPLSNTRAATTAYPNGWLIPTGRFPIGLTSAGGYALREAQCTNPNARFERTVLGPGAKTEAP